MNRLAPPLLQEKSDLTKLWFSVLVIGLLLVACAPAATPAPPTGATPAATPPGAETPASIPTTAPPHQVSAVPATATSEASVTPSIVGVDWDANNHIIYIGIDPWPESWSAWTMLVDGEEISTGEESGEVIVRPDAPLDQPPSGVIVGTLPWVTGLDEADFPCCGTLQFRLPDRGLTNSYEYNLRDFGCVTASAKVCRAEWAVHEGDWIIEGTETIENQKMLQRGNTYVRSGATLLVKNSQLAIERGSTPTIHVYIFVDPGGTLIIDNSKVYPGPNDGGLTCVWNRGHTTLVNSPTSIHYLDMGNGATLTMDNSSMIFEIGGLLQVAGGNTTVTNSTLGALALGVPAGAHLTATGLKFGAQFDRWRVQDLIPEASYQLTFDNVKLLEDFVGECKHGPYERGWIFFLHPDSHVRLSDSELRKVFIDLRGDTADFRNLTVEAPASLTYRDIVLENVAVSGEWGFTIADAQVTFSDSDYLFLQPSGSSTLRLINSHMVEFIPRGFTGTIAFENGSWTNAGEILGGVQYHSSSNNFKMTGSVKLGSELRENLQWRGAQVTREFDVILTDAQGTPVSGAVIKINGKEYMTSEAGTAKFSILYDETNYDLPMTLEAWFGDKAMDREGIDFFSETPIRLQ